MVSQRQKPPLFLHEQTKKVYVVVCKYSPVCNRNCLKCKYLLKELNIVNNYVVIPTFEDEGCNCS